jgi:type I restriction enzyme S subunit
MWKKVKIEEVSEKVGMGPFGSSIKVETFVTTGIPIISGQHLHGSRLNENEGFNFLSLEHAEKLKNANVFKGDIVFTHAGNIGQVAYIPKCSKYNRYVISQRQFYMRCDTSKAIPEFVVAFFKTPEGQHKLLANRSQVGVPSISRPVTYLRSIEIPLPPLPEQRAIAHILGTLDDKIELNRRMNETLEAMAQALFKSWFVDFDPVRAKAEGRDTGLPKEIADLFPDGFEESELGEIPKGWEVVPFTNVVEIVGGGTPKTSVENYWNGNIPWFSVEDSPPETEIWVIDTKRKITGEGLLNSSTKILPVGSTIITARGTVGKVALVGVPMAMNQSCYGIRGRNGINFWTYFLTRELIGGLKKRAHGSVFDTITRNTLESVLIVDPPNNVLVSFENQVKTFLDRIHLSLNESKSLSHTRDLLLPKLLSGDLKTG